MAAIGSIVSVAVERVDVDLLQPGGDRRLDPAVAGADDELAVDLADHGRLQQADRLDRGHELGVHLLGDGGAPGVVGVELEGARVDAAECGHQWLLGLLPALPICSGKTPPKPPRRGQARQGRSRRSRAAEGGPLPRRTRCGSRNGFNRLVKPPAGLAALAVWARSASSAASCAFFPVQLGLERKWLADTVLVTEQASPGLSGPSSLLFLPVLGHPLQDVFDAGDQAERRDIVLGLDLPGPTRSGAGSACLRTRAATSGRPRRPARTRRACRGRLRSRRGIFRRGAPC